MADFCKQCSIEIFGEDCGDLANLITEDDVAKGLFASELCEGCGVIQVNIRGECVSDCFEHHWTKGMPVPT